MINQVASKYNSCVIQRSYLYLYEGRAHVCAYSVSERLNSENLASKSHHPCFCTTETRQIFIFRNFGKGNNGKSAAESAAFICFPLFNMPEPDPRHVVGGTCWAKATTVSNDARRIYGVDAAKIWLRGTVLEVLSVRSEGAQRATTMIKARFPMGNSEKIKVIHLQQLKKKNPDQDPAASAPGISPDAAPAVAPPTVPQAAVETSPAETTAPQPVAPAAGPGSTQTEGTSVSNTSSIRIPVVTAHNRQWFEGETELPTNGPFTRRTWKLTCQYTGKEFTPGCDTVRSMKPIDYFLAVFPKAQLKLMVEETSKKLVEAGKPKVTKGEILKWLGILLLITRFEFGDRRDLWSTRPSSKYVPAANLGEKTGMSRDRFETLLRLMVWSVQPPVRPEGMSHEAYRWLLVEDFVANFNEHRKQYFSPSWHLCADESISRWYGLGGHWINMELPMYVAMDRKPEDGMEIQDCCCAKSDIMYQLKLIKTAAANAE